MLHADVKDNPVMIVSIAGALRKGKSFLLGFFLKYLEAEVTTLKIVRNVLDMVQIISYICFRFSDG